MLILSILAYVFGHIIYGLGDLKEKWKGEKSYNKTILKPIQHLTVFIESKEFIKEKFSENIDEIEVRSLRNIVMSYLPESDEKIYTFMFRSELSRHTGLISLIIGSVGLLSCLLHIDLFKSECIYALIYVLLIISYFLLKQPRDKFYRIAMTLPFNLFVAKIKELS